MSDTEVSKLSIIIRMFLHWCTSYRCTSSYASSVVLVKLNCSRISVWLVVVVCLFRLITSSLLWPKFVSFVAVPVKNSKLFAIPFELSNARQPQIQVAAYFLRRIDKCVCKCKWNFPVTFSSRPGAFSVIAEWIGQPWPSTAWPEMKSARSAGVTRTHILSVCVRVSRECYVGVEPCRSLAVSKIPRINVSIA